MVGQPLNQSTGQSISQSISQLQWGSKVLGGRCAEFFWVDPSIIVFGLKQYKLCAFKLISCAYVYITLQLGPYSSLKKESQNSKS